MTLRDYWRNELLEARRWPIGSVDREHRRRAARKYGVLVKGGCVRDWSE